MSNLSFEEKVEQLQQELDSVSKCINTQDKCLPITLIIAALTPVVVALALYFGKFGFVTKKEGNKVVRSASKIFQYTIILTVVVWIILFGVLYGFGGANSLLCLIK